MHGPPLYVAASGIKDGGNDAGQAGHHQRMTRYFSAPWIVEISLGSVSAIFECRQRARLFPNLRIIVRGPPQVPELTLTTMLWTECRGMGGKCNLNRI